MKLTPAHGGGAGFAHVLHMLVALDNVVDGNVGSGVVVAGVIVESVCSVENFVRYITFPKESVVDIGRAPLASMANKSACVIALDKSTIIACNQNLSAWDNVEKVAKGAEEGRKRGRTRRRVSVPKRGCTFACLCRNTLYQVLAKR